MRQKWELDLRSEASTVKPIRSYSEGILKADGDDLLDNFASVGPTPRDEIPDRPSSLVLLPQGSLDGKEFRSLCRLLY